MKSKVLEVFSWCPNGFTTEKLAVGDVRDFGAVTAGLIEAKLIAPTGVVEETVTAVVAAIAEPVVELVTEPIVEPVVVVPVVAPTPTPTPNKNKRHR